MEITTKSSQSIYEMCKFMNFRNLMKKLEKTAECSFKKLILGQTSMKFDGCYVKTYGHVIDKSKFPQRMKEQLLKVSASQSESPFQIKERKKARGGCIQPPPLPSTSVMFSEDMVNNSMIG